MHTVKAMERRFEKEDENMTQMPEQEEAIFVKLGDENSHIPAGKTVIEYELSKLVTPDGKKNFSRRNSFKNKRFRKNLYDRSQQGRKNDSSKKDSGRTPKSE